MLWLVCCALWVVLLNWAVVCVWSPRDPERGWDRSKVRGLLANLITVKEVAYATGLEVVAGGRLYNIVVDTEVGLCVRSVICLMLPPP